MLMFTICSSPFAVRDMSDQLLLPGFERHPAFDVLFFGLLLEAENASRIVQLRKRLCEEFGLSGRRIAADLLHISLHGIGAYDGLPRAVVQRAKQAGAAVLAQPFDIVLDRAMSFGPKRKVRPFVLTHWRRSGAGYFPSVTWQGDEKCRISPNSIAVHAAHDSAVRRSHVGGALHRRDPVDRTRFCPDSVPLGSRQTYSSGAVVVARLTLPGKFMRGLAF